MIRQSNNNSQRVTGFTLVELLLAITLMSILLGLTYTGLRAAARSSERGEIMLAAGGEMRASHQFVRRQINQMLPLSFAVTDDSDAIRIVFVGDAKHIQYVAPMPGYLAPVVRRYSCWSWQAIMKAMYCNSVMHCCRTMKRATCLNGTR